MTPPRYQNAKYSQVPKKIRDLVANMEKSKRGIYIHGDVGLGKTHILYGIANRFKEVQEKAQKEGKFSTLSCRVYNTTDFLRRIKDDFDSKTPENLLVRTLGYEGLLMLDDVGSEKLTDWVQETFYLIVNSRYEEVWPFIITSNFSIKDLADRIGDRTVSRIVEMCDVVELKGKDRRMERSKKITIDV